MTQLHSYSPQLSQHKVSARRVSWHCSAAGEYAHLCSNPPAGRPTATNSNSSLNGGTGNLPQANRLLPVGSNHNNAVPMPRNTAAAAAAATVAAPAPALPAQQLDPVVQPPRTRLPRYPLQRQQLADVNSSRGNFGRYPAAEQVHQHSKAAPDAKSSRRLTKAIMACSSFGELQQVYNEHQHELNLIHISAVFKQLTRLLQQQQHVWSDQQQLQLQQRFVQQLELHCVQLLSTVQLPQPAALQATSRQLPYQHALPDPWLEQPPQPPQPPQQQQQQQQQQQHSVEAACGHYSSSSRSSSVGHGLYGAGYTRPHPQATVMPQQLCTICWSCAHLGHQPGASWWGCYWAASTPLLATYSSRELATAIAAAGDLQQVPPASWMSGFEAACVSGGLAAASPQELCMLLRGVAVLRLNPGRRWVDALQASVLQQLHCMGPRDMAQVLWGHARLRLTLPTLWLNTVLAAAAEQRSRFSARDTAMLLWALAGLGHLPEPQFLSDLLRGLALSSCKLKAAAPQDVAHISWASATLQRLAAATHASSRATCRSGSCSTDAEQQQHRQQLWEPEPQLSQQQQQQQQQQLQPQQMVLQQRPLEALPPAELLSWFRLAWQVTAQPTAALSNRSGSLGGGAFASRSAFSNKASNDMRGRLLAMQGSTAAAAAATTAAAGSKGPGCFKQLAVIDAAQLLWAASQLDRSCWPTRSWMGQFWLQNSSPDLAHASAQSLTVILWASLQMGHRPPANFLMAAVPALQRQLAELQPAATCQLLYVLAKLQHRPNPLFMEQLLSRLQLDCHHLQPRAFACVLWSLGRLGFNPGETWWGPVLHHLEGLVEQLGERELANVLFGLAALGMFHSSSSSSSRSSDDGGGGSGSGRSGSGSSDCKHVRSLGASLHLRHALLQRAMQLGVLTEVPGAPEVAADAVGVVGVPADSGCPSCGTLERQRPLQQLVALLS